MVTVRRAILEDRPAIVEFLKQAYAGRWQYKYPERWEWEYVNNPFLAGSDLPVWIAVEEDGRVVGQTCALVEPVKIGAEEHRIGWSVDTYLLKEYRGQGVGFQLQKANDEGNPIFMSLSNSKANRRIKAGLGSVPLDPVPEYIRLTRYTAESVRAAVVDRMAPKEGLGRSLLRAALRFSLADRAGSALLNARRAMTADAALPPVPASIEIVERSEFDELADKLWASLSGRFYAIVRRDAAYLNWKYNRQPHAAYQNFFAMRKGEPAGYVIVRVGQPPEPKIGILADLFADPEDVETTRALLTFALRWFKGKGVKDVRAASSQPAIQKAFVAYGFQQFHEATPMLHCKLETPTCQGAADPGCWFLSKGDHDWDQYPLAH